MALIESFSGVRGIFKKELTPEMAENYAHCYSKILPKNSVVVIGQDTRISGNILKSALVKGLNCKIIDVGTLPTATIEHAVRYFNADGGIIITASHNEPEFNGFKFLSKDGAVLRPKPMQRVINYFHQNLKYSPNKHYIIIDKHDETLESYNEFILSFLSEEEIKLIQNSNIQILVDPNGGTGHIAKAIFDKLNIKAKFINTKEGIFSRKIEPTLNSLSYLLPHLTKGMFAAGFDCDADRVEILLDNGELVSGNQTLALITQSILLSSKNPQEETIVVNDATSYLVKEIVGSFNASWKEVEVGEINVVDKMLETNSKIGGEGSNGGIITPPSRCRDGILTLVLLFKLLAKENKSLEELVQELPNYNYSKIKIKLTEDFTILRNNVIKYYQDNNFKIQLTGDETGGLKAIKNNSWVWFRQSKTEDKVLRIIANSKEEKVVKALLEQAQILLSNS